MSETVSIWWDEKEDRLMIKNTAGDKIALTKVEGINAYRILNKSIKLKDKIKLAINGNKMYGKMIK